VLNQRAQSGSVRVKKGKCSAMEEKVVPESAPAPSEAPPVATVSAEEEVVR